MLPLFGSTSILVAVGGTCTVIRAEAFFPSAVAVIDVEPCETPVTTPDAVTLATDGSFDDHEIGRESGFPWASSAVAINCIVLVTSSVAEIGDTVMLAARTG